MSADRPQIGLVSNTDSYEKDAVPKEVERLKAFADFHYLEFNEPSDSIDSRTAGELPAHLLRRGRCSDYFVHPVGIELSRAVKVVLALNWLAQLFRGDDQTQDPREPKQSHSATRFVLSTCPGRRNHRDRSERRSNSSIGNSKSQVLFLSGKTVRGPNSGE